MKDPTQEVLTKLQNLAEEEFTSLILEPADEVEQKKYRNMAAKLGLLCSGVFICILLAYESIFSTADSQGIMRKRQIGKDKKLEIHFLCKLFYGFHDSRICNLFCI